MRGWSGDTPAPLSDSNKAQAPNPEASAVPETPAENSSSTPTSPAAGEVARGASESEDPAPAGKRRRRRRRGGRNKKAEDAEQGSSASTPADPAPIDPGLAALAGGLLSHIDERQIPCSNEGCSSTWTWTATEQIAAYGQPPPRRECDSCAGTSAMEARCSVEGCRRTWTWHRDAQIKHRSWAKRHGDERGGGKQRRRRGDGPPRRKCELCQAKLAKLTERPSVCKVHGCTRPVIIDREGQLRAWAATGSTDLDFEAPLAKQMCEVCREFCRAHDDRAVPCGRPGCDRTWTYKRGAQLQAFLAGRFDDPIRLCEPCESETRKAAHGVDLPANVEVMPCIVPGCSGVWHYRTGQKLGHCQDGERPVQRMCDEHRRAHGADPRAVPAARRSSAAAAVQGQTAPDSDTSEAVVNADQDTPETDREIVISSDPIS